MNTKQTVLIGLVAVFSLSIIGCGAIIHGSKQNVMFQTNPDGASVEVYDAMDVSFGSCTTPCTLELKRKNEYKVILSKPGYQPAEMVIQKGTSGWIWGNLLFGGLIGLVVDLTSGSAYKLKNDMIEVTLSKTTIGAIPDLNTEGIVIIDFETLSDEEKAKVVKLESIDIGAGHITIQ